MGMSGKTEKPTPKRIRDARKEGRVARSQELIAASGLLIGVMLLTGPGSGIVSELSGMLVDAVNAVAFVDTGSLDLQEMFINIVWRLGPSLAILMVGVMLTSILVTGVQTQFLWNTKGLKPDFKRLNPIQGIKNKFFSIRGAAELAKSILKLVVIGWVAYSFLTSHYEEVLNLGNFTLKSGIAVWMDLAVSLAIRVGTAYLLLAIIDYIYQRWEYMRSLRMTKQEIKEEYKQAEGDPLLKGRIRGQQRQMAQRRMMSKVPDATVVITNPTHFAVALEYSPELMAPVVVAKGAYKVAERIIEIAKEKEVPVIQNVPLARGLYRAVEIDQEISPEFYRAVAEVLAYIFKMKPQKKAVRPAASGINN
jgi:flagellar biosynthetic protein FlhB